VTAAKFLNGVRVYAIIIIIISIVIGVALPSCLVRIGAVGPAPPPCPGLGDNIDIVGSSSIIVGVIVGAALLFGLGYGDNVIVSEDAPAGNFGAGHSWSSCFCAA
jgi:hypothetical protein